MFRDTFLDEDCVLTTEDVRTLIDSRNAYDYPRAFMELSSQPTDFPLAKDAWARPVQPNGAITDFALDEYHRRLLNDTSPVNNLLGTTSVIYWGFYTWSPAIAKIRARRHLLGYRSKPGTRPEVIAEALAAVDCAVDMGQGSSEYRVPVGFLVLPSLAMLQISRYSQDPKSPTFPGRFTLALNAAECVRRLLFVIPRFLCLHYRWLRPRPLHLSDCPISRGHLCCVMARNVFHSVAAFATVAASRTRTTKKLFRSFSEAFRRSRKLPWRPSEQ
ncbi:hypothetical protein BVER_02505c [Candidatus Burkholderia verschuerenii]|uniref:Uncharacterized protein n=1 Tax=Candidatus Burkholderia verschuerenii TaxID=242163 RepID=A0A0L0M3Y6_9BURK|nr:hypothetical protein [Candidatus Burkholderia verschuerenii]KND57068.1 hypothetical protein BVER_02505c [Candidatus Burkholderia verschuerenii]